MQTTENTTKLCQFIMDKFKADELNNDSLVQVIGLCGSMLNLMPIQEYAYRNNLSYNGVKKHRKVIELFRSKFVIDNE